MKKYLPFLIILLLVIATFSSCKKDNNAIVPKDYTAVIKDKTWAGTLTNAGEKPQSYSVYFNADNTLLWSQLSGDYPGRWLVDKNKLTLNFTSPAVIVTTDISEDNKWVNIGINTANKVNSGELVQNPDVMLDNTMWKGTFISNNLYPTLMEVTFLPGSKVTFKYGSRSSVTLSYSRFASGGAIWFYEGVDKYFGVITSGSQMNGNYYTSNYSWQVTKQ